jgi:di/tripeptidase
LLAEASSAIRIVGRNIKISRMWKTMDRIDIEKSVRRIQDVANFMLQEYGAAKAKQELDSDFAPRIAIEASKKLLMAMPALELCDDKIEHYDSLYSVRLNRLQDALDGTDGMCGGTE